MPKHTYQSAEKFVLSREFFGMKLGLENIRTFLESLDSPQEKQKTIHIAGTNGKGSTASMLASVLQSQGYKTGLFTSPHLISFRERIKVNGRKIPKQSLVAFIDKNRKELTKRKLSFFELCAAMAFDHFAKCKVDIAVIETGLGGRLDATNVLAPILTLTTSISKDHVEILGDTIVKIAKEKAGIIKPTCPHLTGILPDKAQEVMRKTCAKKKTKLYSLKKSKMKIYPDKLSFEYSSKQLNLKKITPSLIGTHQIQNAALVVKAVEILKSNGLKISNKSIKSGIENTLWAARFQIKEYRTKPTHIFDVSHNVKGVESFVESFRIKYPNQTAYILTGFVKRKEHQKIFNLLSRISTYYALVPLSTKRSTDVAEIIKQIDFKAVPCKKYGKIESGYNAILKMTNRNDIIIVIGSHYLVGEFFEKFNIR